MFKTRDFEFYKRQEVDLFHIPRDVKLTVVVSTFPRVEYSLLDREVYFMNNEEKEQRARNAPGWISAFVSKESISSEEASLLFSKNKGLTEEQALQERDFLGNFFLEKDICGRVWLTQWGFEEPLCLVS